MGAGDRDGDGDEAGNSNARPLREFYSQPLFSSCVGCVAEAALRPPASAVSSIHSATGIASILSLADIESNFFLSFACNVRR